MKTRAGGLLRRIFLLPIDVYGMMTLLLLVGQLVIGERLNVIAFCNTFAHIYWMPALFFLPLALILRSRVTMGLLLPAALAFVLTFGYHFLPKAPLTITPDQTTFTVATFNLYDDDRTPEGIVSVVEAMNADVVAFQELSPLFADALDEYFADIYPYRALHGGERDFRGAGIMSKYPITADRYWTYDWMKAPLGHQRVELDINGHALTLYNLHPVNPAAPDQFFDPTVRGQEIAALMEETRSESGPLMLVGDFNMPDVSNDYHRITSEYGLTDAFGVRGLGLGLTFTNGLTPMLRLDYMFLGAGVDVAEINVWPESGGSDHRPLVARLALK